MFGVNYYNVLNCIALYRTVKYSGKVHWVPEVFSLARRDVSRSDKAMKTRNRPRKVSCTQGNGRADNSLNPDFLSKFSVQFVPKRTGNI